MKKAILLIAVGIALLGFTSGAFASVPDTTPATDVATTEVQSTPVPTIGEILGPADVGQTTIAPTTILAVSPASIVSDDPLRATIPLVADGELPRTGQDSFAYAALALGLAAVGLLAVVLSRRPS